MKIRFFILLLLFISGGYSCTENEKKAEVREILKKWMNKEILLPDHTPCYSLSGDTLAYTTCNDLLEKNYKILLYADSLGCTKCKLNLQEWMHIIAERDNLFAEQLSFLFFFQPKHVEELQLLMSDNGFFHAVFIDSSNIINQLNKFPGKVQYQCFLLDKTNKVIGVGNPTFNIKLWEMYKKEIAGGNNNLEKPLKKFTSIKVDKLTHELGCIKLGANYSAIFQLTNTGDNPLLIDRVTSSCGCVSVEWDKKPITIGETTDIRLNIKPDEVGYFSKTIIVHCNIKNMQLSLKLNGMVII